MPYDFTVHDACMDESRGHGGHGGLDACTGSHGVPDKGTLGSVWFDTAWVTCDPGAGRGRGRVKAGGHRGAWRSGAWPWRDLHQADGWVVGRSYLLGGVVTLLHLRRRTGAGGMGRCMGRPGVPSPGKHCPGGRQRFAGQALAHTVSSMLLWPEQRSTSPKATPLSSSVSTPAASSPGRSAAAATRPPGRPIPMAAWQPEALRYAATLTVRPEPAAYVWRGWHKPGFRHAGGEPGDQGTMPGGHIRRRRPRRP